jgi:hypothetical protein
MQEEKLKSLVDGLIAIRDCALDDKNFDLNEQEAAFFEFFVQSRSTKLIKAVSRYLAVLNAR